VRGGGSIIDIGGNVRDQVMRNVRRGYIAGYGYPIYGGAAPAAPASHPATHPAGHANPYPRPTGIIQLGSRGNGVKYVQWALGFNTQDGIFGSGTLARVIQFQRAHGLAVDGQVGPHTLGVLAGVHR
jgi:peptidoglycan hydrolase-like protein with peptidoglycan-binding domain